MLADGANIGSLDAHDQMAAVTALPQGHAALLKDFLILIFN